MMLTGAYEGFVVACHRHRDQTHGNCSGFRWEEVGRKLLVCIWLFYLAAKEREKVVLGGERRGIPFFAILSVSPRQPGLASGV